MSRFSVDFTEEAEDQIQHILKSTHSASKAEVVRKALGLLHYIEKARADGGKVIIEQSSTGTRTEIVSF